MERKIEVEVSLNGLDVEKSPIFCQGDKNTHFINIKFMEDMELEGYTLQVFYLPPYPSVTPLVDLFTNITSNFTIPIPNRVLLRNGKVKVEFGLSKGEEVITINKTFDFEVIKTINGTSLTAYPEGELKETIAQQIEKIKLLLSQSQEKIDEYNQNVTEKTQTFNNNFEEKLKIYNDNDTSKTNIYNQNAKEKLNTYNENDKLKKEAYDNNATEKLKAYNDNDVSKTTAYNQNAEQKLNTYNDNDSSKTSAFNENAKNKTTKFDTHVKNTTDNAYLEMDKKATEYANTAGEKANLKVKEQENLSIQAVINEGTKQVGLVGTKGTEEVEKIQSAGVKTKEDAVAEINTAKTKAIDGVKQEADTYVTETSKPSIDEYVENTSKTEINNHVENVSKKSINDYVTIKEEEIKGATFTPVVSPNGDLSFTNDKNLPNPEVVNIKGEKGDPGNFSFQIEDGHLVLYTVDNGAAPTFYLENGHLIMEIN